MEAARLCILIALAIAIGTLVAGAKDLPECPHTQSKKTNCMYHMEGLAFLYGPDGKYIAIFNQK